MILFYWHQNKAKFRNKEKVYFYFVISVDLTFWSETVTTKNSGCLEFYKIINTFTKCVVWERVADDQC